MITLRKGIVYILAIIIALLWLIPILLTVTMAFKSPTDFASHPFWSLPQEFNLFKNIGAAWSSAGLGQGFVNSLIYGVLGSALAVLIAAFTSYGLVVLKLRGAFIWFLVIFSGTLFPYQLYIVPLFQMYSTLGLYDTQLGMVLFYTAMSIPFCTLVLRGFFSTISREIIESSRVDGASEVRIFFRMYLPLSFSALAVLCLLQFTWIWNDLLFGLVLSSSPDVRPVMPSLNNLTGTYSGSSFSILLAGVLVASIPTLLLFFGLQKYFIQGLTLSVKTR
jgi:multiple sugar transport system permease protein